MPHLLSSGRTIAVKTMTLMVCAALLPVSLGICWPCATAFTPAAHDCCSKHGDCRIPAAPVPSGHHDCSSCRLQRSLAVSQIESGPNVPLHLMAASVATHGFYGIAPTNRGARPDLRGLVSAEPPPASVLRV